ncbi:hypothetical protein AB0P17_08345 [Streptomyces sp. NPDC088124]|uniref:hypothetical protein n=1 Tax=Streptomyces sp. NPDC088124 TaxID=3154654 RepID=UPI00342A6805
MLTEVGQRRLRAAAAAEQHVEEELFRSLDDSRRSLLTQLHALLRVDLTGGNEHCGSPTSLDRTAM